MANDNAGDFRLIERLDGSNYSAWSWKLKILMRERGLWGVIDGSEVVEMDEEGHPKNATRVESMKVKEAKAYMTICMALGDAAIAQVRDTETAKQVWEVLKKTYEATGFSSILTLHRQLSAVKMTEGDSMAGHIDKIKTIWRQMETAGAVLDKRQLVYTLITSLPASYDPLVMTLDGFEEKLDLEFVARRLLQEEARRRVNPPSDEMALLSSFRRTTIKDGMQYNSKQGRGQGWSDERKKKRCFYYDQAGHFIRDCRKKKEDLKRGESSEVNLVEEDEELPKVYGLMAVIKGEDGESSTIS